MRCRRLLPILLALLPLLVVVGFRAPAPATERSLAEPVHSVAEPVRTLHVLVLLYPRSFAHVLSAAEMERLQEEIVEFADFYQTHGAGRVEFRFTLLQLDRQLRRAEVSEVVPGRYYLSREDVEAELEALGMRGRFDEVVAFYAWSNANSEAAVLAYGGGAVGPDGGFLGDAGFNSIGVFAWDPGRIAQVAIHEVLHNLDDMFSRSGMAEEFLNSDEMSRNMPQLLRERPGAFLPYFTDREMRAYALREQAGREMYPWWMQRIYYAWMLQRTPASAWNALRYGRMSEPRTTGEARPVYDAVHVSRATRRVFLPVLDAPDGVRATVAGRQSPMEARRYALEDFDGTPLVEEPWHAAWIDIGQAPTDGHVSYSGTGARTAVHRLQLGDVVAPAYALAREDDGTAAFEALVREAGWPEPGDTIPSRMRTAAAPAANARTGFDAVSSPSTEEPSVATALGERAARQAMPRRVHRLRVPAGRTRLLASADSFWIAPAPLQVERRGDWGIAAPAVLDAGMATPAGLRVELADRRPVRARVTARVNGRELPLDLQPDGAYHAVLDDLPPGLHEAEITAVREDGSSARDTVLVYARPSGWIRTPTAIAPTPDAPAVLEVTVRSRMGRMLRGLGLPLIAIADGRVHSFVEDPATGAYTTALTLPQGEHRIVVTSLEGDFQRRVVIARSPADSTAALPGAGIDAARARAHADARLHDSTVTPAATVPRNATVSADATVARGALGPLPIAAAVHARSAPAIDGDLEDWRSAPVVIGPASHLLTTTDHYHGSGDLRAEFWFAWDDTTLYVAGRVRDDSVTVGEAWDRDRINLVLDWREDDTPLTYGERGSVAVAEWQADDYWLFFQPFWSTTAPGTPRRIDRLGTHALAGARLASRRTADGYTFELAVTAADLPEYTPFAGHVAALQLFVTDGDAEPGVTELMWSHRWPYSADSGLGWELARMGRLVFVDDAR